MTVGQLFRNQPSTTFQYFNYLQDASSRMAGGGSNVSVVGGAMRGVEPPPGRLSRQPVVDLVVAMVSVPLLVVFGLMLESNMRGDWATDADSRWNVLGLGLALLLVSLLVCCYVTHRLGICIWSAHNRQHQARLASAAAARQHPNALTSVSSQLHLVSGGELPPSYDAVVAFDIPPPPYCAVFALPYDQKPPASLTTATATSTATTQTPPVPPTPHPRVSVTHVTG